MSSSFSMVIDDFHNGQMVPLGPEARAGMPTLPYVDGNSWVITGKRPVSTDPPSATLATHPWARRPERRANSRPPALLCQQGSGARRGLADDREAPWTHPGSDDGPLRPSRARYGQGIRSTHRRQHRRRSGRRRIVDRNTFSPSTASKDCCRPILALERTDRIVI